jgi:NAD(P)-dependent dehydrogenase (short-subunit alcohol dehydrogenase family)
MCKAALERFTTGLASEVAADGVAVNVVSPGLVETPGTLLHNLVNDNTRSRVQPIEYIAEAVFQLSSCDPKVMTGRIDYAEPFLKGLALEPAALI